MKEKDVGKDLENQLEAERKMLDEVEVFKLSYDPDSI